MIATTSPLVARMAEDWRLRARRRSARSVTWIVVGDAVARSAALATPALRAMLRVLFAACGTHRLERAEHASYPSVVRTVSYEPRCDRSPARTSRARRCTRTIRDDYRNRVIELKQPRRVLIGDVVELVFDNRLTLTMQIEEICRLENLTRDEQINEEIALTNELMPTDDSLAATLFIALPQDEQLKDAAARSWSASTSTSSCTSARTRSARRSSPAARRRSRSRRSSTRAIRCRPRPRPPCSTPGTPIAVEIDHPNYRHRVQCSEELRASLAADYGADRNETGWFFVAALVARAAAQQASRARAAAVRLQGPRRRATSSPATSAATSSACRWTAPKPARASSAGDRQERHAPGRRARDHAGRVRQGVERDRRARAGRTCKDCTNGTLEKRDPVYQFDVKDDENKASFSCQTREVPYPYNDIIDPLDLARAAGPQASSATTSPPT